MNGYEQGVAHVMRRRIKSLCRELDVSDISYCVDIKNYSNFFPDEGTVHRRWQKRKALHSSSAKMDQFLGSWKRTCAKSDRNFPDSIKCVIHHWRYQESNKISKCALNLIDNFGYQSISSIRIPCPFSSNYVGNFVVVDLQNQGSSLDVDKLLLVLESFHIRANIDFRCEINPMIDFSLIKPNTLRVLKMLAFGHSRADIADRCFITERGVDYHIDAVKSILGAKNISELVYRSRCEMII